VTGGIEAALFKLGQAVISPAVKQWLARRRDKADIDLPLADLLHAHTTDVIMGRRLERHINEMIDNVAERMIPAGTREWNLLAENERIAVIETLTAALVAALKSDDVFFDADADPGKLALLIKVSAQSVVERAALSADGQALFDVLLSRCCDSYAKAVINLRSFAPRAERETLRRLTMLSEQLNELLNRVPARTPDAPEGDSLDDQFRRRYIEYVAATCDDVELFGIDVRNFRPRTALRSAYVSLNAAVSRPPEDAGDDWSDTTVHIERALGSSRLALVRGEAGSGKTTLLRWLAVTAARSAFTGDLASWNGRVPILLRLRGFEGAEFPDTEGLVMHAATPLAEVAPRGWAFRELASGRALLLLDGVDEIRTQQRQDFRTWLANLLAVFPAATVVVASRPAAASAHWLAAEGFRTITLEPMQQQQTQDLIARWHVAITDAGRLPCDAREIPRYQNALVARLEANAYLQGLAKIPLLCAVLCALNLDRRTNLPRDRMSVYRAAVDLMLDRRDAERNIPGLPADLSGRDKLQVLQYLAWRMSVNNLAETSREQAITYIKDKLDGMPQVEGGAAFVYDHLIHRSGIIREPAYGRMDFLHSNFQEYLTAIEAAERGDVGLLIDRADLESWRHIVVMAAGHANALVRADLIGQILDRADATTESGRSFALLAAACLETVPSLEPALLREIERTIMPLLPPHTKQESRLLSAMGEPLLRYLPPSTELLRESEAVATVYAAAMVNGSAALTTLARYAPDRRDSVQRELVASWGYFDPETYARRVLADAQLPAEALYLTNPQLLPHLGLLHHLREFDVDLAEPADLSALGDAAGLRSLRLHRGGTSSLGTLPSAPALRRLIVDDFAAGAEPLRLPRLDGLVHLNVQSTTPLPTLAFLAGLPGLGGLGLGRLGAITDWSPLLALRGLDQLLLVEPAPVDLTAAESLPYLQYLSIVAGADLAVTLPSVFGRAHSLETLQLSHCTWLRKLDGIEDVPTLTGLSLQGCAELASLDPLAKLAGLWGLHLDGCARVDDLSALADLRQLRELRLVGVAPGIDLSPLAGHAALTVWLAEHQQVRGVERLGTGVRLAYPG
jgi:hypothetical protein